MQYPKIYCFYIYRVCKKSKKNEDKAMAVGASNNYDQCIVDTYKEMQTYNENLESKVDPEKIMQTISIVGYNNKLFFEVQQNLGIRKGDLNLIKNIA